MGWAGWALIVPVARICGRSGAHPKGPSTYAQDENQRGGSCPFSSRPLQRSQTLRDGTGGIKRQAPLPMSWAGPLVPLFVLHPSPPTPLTFSILLRCRQSLPAFGVSQPWAARLCLSSPAAQWMMQPHCVFNTALGEGEGRARGKGGNCSSGFGVVVTRAAQGWRWCPRKE